MGRTLYKTKAYKPYVPFIVILYIVFAVALILGVMSSAKYREMAQLSAEAQPTPTDDGEGDEENEEDSFDNADIEQPIPTEAEISEKGFLARVLCIVTVISFAGASTIMITQLGYSKQSLIVSSSNVEGNFRISATSTEWTSYEFDELAGVYYEGTDIVLVLQGGSSVRFRRMKDADEACEIIKDMLNRQ